MSATEPPSLAFDDVVIDLAGRRLLRAGEVQPLEPKAFAVLVLLAGSPGHAFGRDQILDAVWGHRHVTPGVLNRVMTMLRHALGEEAHAPRYLHTLHGVGYRFDLPAPAMAGAVPVAAAGADSERRAQLERRMPGATAAPTSALAWSWPWRMLAGVIVLCAVIAGVWRWQAAQTPARNPAVVVAATSAPTLIVMPLKPIGGTAADRELAAGLSDELISALSRIDGLRVIARESTSLATAQSTGIATLVSRLGISHALEGSLRQSGEALRIHLRLTEAGSGRAVWVQDYDRDATEMLTLEREIAQAVAAALTLKLGLAFGPVGKGGDVDYYRRYLAARALLFTRPLTRVDNSEQAETRFRALLEQQPDDARVHAGLALALDQRAFQRPALATRLRAEAAREAVIALSLDPTLPDPYRVQATAACRNSDWERCLALFRKAIALAPSETPPQFQYAMALAALGYLDQAEDVMRRGVERDPLNPGWRFGYGRILDTRGRHDEARAQLARSESFSHYARWFNAMWRGDYVDARRHADAIGSNDSERSNPYSLMLRRSYLLATEALIDPRRWPEAQAAMREFEQQSGLMNFLSVLHPVRDVPKLIDGLDEVRQRSYSSWDLLLWTHDLAYLRRDPAFQRYLQRNGIFDYWKVHGFPAQCRPQGDAAVCD